MLSTFITFGSAEMDTMTGYIFGFLQDVSPLLLLICGIAVGLIIFGAITYAIKH